MANKYHINPNTGRVGICTATTRGCGFGEHFDSKEEGNGYIEATEALNNSLFKTSTKTKGKLASYTQATPEEIAERDREKYGDELVEAIENEHYEELYMTSDDNSLAIAHDYPVGSVLEITSKKSKQSENKEGGLLSRLRRNNDDNNAQPKIIRARIIENNSRDFIAVNTETGKTYNFGMDEGAELYAWDYDINVVSKGPAVDVFTVRDPLHRALKNRHEFDERYKVGDTIQVFSNMNYDSSINGNYKLYHTDADKVSLQNVDNGELLNIENKYLDSSSKYSFVKIDDTPAITANNSGLQDYINGRSPYPTSGFGYSDNSLSPVTDLDYIDR